MSTTKKVLLIIGALAVVGAVVGGGLYLAFPVQMSQIGGPSRNYFLTLSAPPGSLTTESNTSYSGTAALEPSPPADAATSGAADQDWPSYNRTLSSDRFSPLTQINTKNVQQLKVLCTYEVGEYASFEAGLLEVNNADRGSQTHVAPKTLLACDSGR